jgi:hypothetical protein
MATIGDMPRGMLYVGTSRCFRYPHYIILANTQEEAEKELRQYMHNLELGINFLKEDSEGSADWLVKKNDRYIEGYKRGVETIKSDLEFGCREAEI